MRILVKDFKNMKDINFNGKNGFGMKPQETKTDGKYIYGSFYGYTGRKVIIRMAQI